ncbi:hypothetical protein MTR_6g034585 [Medicago truncatula]|uniref:Uncharacterized protein n=1 Tax=Medicago truncatula TaxID=3880 RepID=A0A072U9P0_MEDTR|nr:hypothetical protein MTR_6g034585 [Medicago truncatula]
MDEDDIVEIHPFKKHKRAILHDVFDIDNGDDYEDLVIVGEKVSKSNKRKIDIIFSYLSGKGLDRAFGMM